MSWIKGLEIQGFSPQSYPIRINTDCPFCDKRIIIWLEKADIVRLIEALQYELNKKELSKEDANAG